MIRTQSTIILASASQSRRAILKSANIVFDVLASSFDEEAFKQAHPSLSPTSLAMALAKEKAHAVSLEHPDAWVIGGDQVCLLKHKNGKEEILGKPITPKRAHAQISKMSGKQHVQYSACVLVHQGKTAWEHLAQASLLMRTLSSEEIQSYLAHDAPFFAAGSYHFEGMAKHLFDEVDGSDDTIKGLPLVPLLSALHRLGVLSFAPAV